MLVCIGGIGEMVSRLIVLKALADSGSIPGYPVKHIYIKLSYLRRISLDNLIKTI